MVGIKGKTFTVNGERVQLAGNHTWNTVQPFNGKVTDLSRLVGNFTRLWTVETRRMVPSASSWGSNTKGDMNVGLVPWKADGTLNKRYYRQLEAVVATANEKDIITGVVLFDNAFTAYFPKGWDNHPFNGLGPRSSEYIHTRGPWNAFQRAHVKRVVKTLADYDNVIYEVGNELHRNSVTWFQGAVIRWVKQWSDKPVGASYASGMKVSRGRTQDWITGVNADWIAPQGVAPLPGFFGPQVLDTDHSSALRSSVSSLRNAWNSGRSLWLMDGLDGHILRNQNSLQPDRNFIGGLSF